MKKNILIITPKYPKSYSGASKQNHKINKLLSSKYNFIVLTKNDANNTYYDGIKIIRIKSIVSKINIINKVIWLIFASIYIIKNKNNYDLVHILGADLEEILLLPLIKIIGKPIVLKRAIAGEISGTQLKKIKGLLIKYFINTVISISNEITDELNKISLNDKTEYIPNGVFLLQSGNKSLIDEPIFSIIGIIRERKGLVEGIKFLNNINPFKKYKLIIAGPIFNQKYWEKVKDLLIISKIEYEYQSYVPNKEMNKLLDKTTFLISMSKKEGLPNIILEGMSRGVPVICSNIEPHREIVRHKYNGMIWDGNKSNQYEILKDAKFYQKLSDAAIKSVRKFDIYKVKNKYDSLYTKLLNI